MKKACKANLPALIFLFALLILWQAGAMGMDAAYILPSPTQILAKLWELRQPLFTVHLPATMLTGCDLLLLDEPFSALDFLTRISMQEWLVDQWQRHKKTILFITHDVEEALFLSQSVLVVEHTPIRELAEIPVPAAFPRDRSSLKLPEMVELKEHLIDLLRKQVTV